MVSGLEEPTREASQPQGAYSPVGVTDKQTPQGSTAGPLPVGAGTHVGEPLTLFGTSEMASQGSKFT